MNTIARCLRFVAVLAAAMSFAPSASATFHLFRIEQVFSNADRTIQFVVLRESENANGEHLWRNHVFRSLYPGGSQSYVFPRNLPSNQTAGRRVLVATEGFAALGIVTPDYVIPNGFLPTGTGQVDFGGADFIDYTSLPTDGVHAIDRNGNVIDNLATNFSGQSGSVVALPTTPPAVFGNFQNLWWKSPGGSESGWGINLNHQGTTIFATWFTFGVDGKPLWMVVSATSTPDAPNTFTGDLYTGTGSPFNAFDSTKLAATKVGTATFTFTDANSATFAWTVNGVTQSKEITRQAVGSPVPACTFGGQLNLALATNFQGIWWKAPANSEPGWGVNLTHHGDTIFLTWFTFGADGNPLWMVVAANKTEPNVYSGTLVKAVSGPPFNGPFDQAPVVGIAVGSVTLTFTDGNNATFEYTVDGEKQTKPITRQVFTEPGTVCQ